MFWRLMPPALVILLAAGWLERVYLQPQPVAEPPQIDTVVKTAMVTRTVEDAVTIEADPEPISSDFVSEAELMGASLNSLSKVRDDTVFRSGDDEAWFGIWQTLRSSDMPAFRKAGVRNVSFAELFGQPRSFRGRLVRFSGTLHRLQKVEAPANQYDITGYWQAWIQPDDGPASPIVVYFLQLPPGLPHGMKINEPVEVIGYFFKRWAYEATDAIRTAPLVMALEPIWKPLKPAPPGGTSIGGYALVTIGLLVAITLLGIRYANGTARVRSTPSAVDLSATLSNIELFSPGEALRQLTASEKEIDATAGHTHSTERPPT